MSLIQPRTLKGFRDLTPRQALLRANMVRKLEDVFRAHGYGPIDTPALEYAEILKGKGGEETDKELFEFTDKGGRQVALRFDLTVPLARYVAEHQGELVFPFRRYHVGPVWRGERPQRGRFREFWQCDADVIGPVGPAADAEALLVMISAYEALRVGGVTLRINDRRILNGVLETLDAADRMVPVLRALDKRERHGDDAVRTEMRDAGLADAAIERILDVCRPRATDAETRDSLMEAVGDNEVGRAGVTGLYQARELVLAAGKPEGSMRVDPGVARGLDYYTGIVLEAQLDDLPDIGSVGSGGRYDDLAGLYTKTRLPGVGVSVGIDRLLAALEEMDAADLSRDASRAMVAHPAPEQLRDAFALAATLRDQGLQSEVFPEPKKHGAQMKYADKQGIAFVFTIDADGSIHGKRLSDGATQNMNDADEAAAWALR